MAEEERKGQPHGPRSRPLRRRPRVARLRRPRHRGSRGARAGAQAPGNVYRRHRRAGAAPPGRRGARQRHGRGGRRARQPHRGRAAPRLRRHRARQRPRHPGRPPSPLPEEVRARGHPLHPARGGQVLRRRLPDLGRAARRRRVGGQRPLGPGDGRGRPQPPALAPGVLPRPPDRPAPVARPRPEPPRHHRHLPPRPGDLRRLAALPPRPPAPDGALQGLPLLRRRDPLALRPRLPRRGGGRARGGHLPLPRRPLGLSRRAARRRAVLRRPPVRGPGRLRRALRRRHRRLGGVGDQLDAAARPLRLLLLQHHPHPGGRHPRGRLLGGAHPRHPRLRRAHLQPPRRPDHPRGRDGRRQRHDLGLHPRAGVRRPDQGPPRHPGGGAAGRGRGARPLRQLAGGRHPHRRRDPRLHRAESGGAAAAAGGEGDPAQDRGEEAPPARASSPTAPAPAARGASFSWSRATRPAARRSRRATGAPRPCCRSGARS